LTAGAFALVLAWWFTLQPSQDRDWQPELAVLAYADVEGSKVTVHNIRNCDYRTETDFDVRYYDRTYDLDTLRSVDLFMVYWGSPNMAHTMVSFGFEGGDYLVFPSKPGNKKEKPTSAIKGLFRQFELIYIAARARPGAPADELPPGRGSLPLSFRVSPKRRATSSWVTCAAMNSLRKCPEWYSALTHNCTTSIRMQRAAADRTPWGLALGCSTATATGSSSSAAMIATNLPLAELKQRKSPQTPGAAADKRLISPI